MMTSSRFFSGVAHLAGATLILPGLAVAGFASAELPTLQKISTDPYTNSSSQHQTEVEPDSFAFGTTMVAAFQVGRFVGGGASNVGFSTTRDGGATWTSGFMPGITTFAGGNADRVSDAAVAYDAAHNVWMVSSLPIYDSGSSEGAGVILNRSTDGGLTFTNPVPITSMSDVDKNWTACDNHPASAFYGHCYTEWDDGNNSIFMSTSTDGGLSWSPARQPADKTSGLGGQPVIQPNGTVVVPIASGSMDRVLSFSSNDGGVSWSKTVTVSNINNHNNSGGMRTPPLPSAQVDAAGTIYVTWSDCRFESGCSANDIVMSTSVDGTKWSQVGRIPTVSKDSNVDQFVPGLGVDLSTSGNTAHLALTYYYYPKADCTSMTCELNVGFISSVDGGSHWSQSVQLAGGMKISWIPNTSQGEMVGDYIATSFMNGTAHPVFAVAYAPATSGTFDQAMYAPTGGLEITAGSGDFPLEFEPKRPGGFTTIKQGLTQRGMTLR